jgi:hypothetical protein
MAGADVELRPFTGRNLDEIVLTARTLHKARAGQLS